jgi:hypothetical protein
MVTQYGSVSAKSLILPSPPTPLPSLGAARARRVPRRFSETRQRGAGARGDGGERAKDLCEQKKFLQIEFFIKAYPNRIGW